MAGWDEVAATAPQLVAAGRSLFDAHKHKVLATLRRDGSPRVSGTELIFDRGHVWIGSMAGARKARDLQRDPRYAVHSAAVSPWDDDPSAWPGDAKFAGTATEIEDVALLDAVLGSEHHEAGAHLFRLDVTEFVVTRLGTPADHLEIWSWHAGHGERLVRRA